MDWVFKLAAELPPSMIAVPGILACIGLARLEARLVRIETILAVLRTAVLPSAKGQEAAGD